MKHEPRLTMRFWVIITVVALVLTGSITGITIYLAQTENEASDVRHHTPHHMTITMASTTTSTTFGTSTTTSTTGMSTTASTTGIVNV